MTRTEFLTLINDMNAKAGAAKWAALALACLTAGHAQFIPQRGRPDLLYLVRMWLSPPRASLMGSPDKFESGDSLLLHYFASADDDGALHDHPWGFTTTVLEGGYTEHLPTQVWLDTHRPHFIDDGISPESYQAPGPAYAGRTIWRPAGSVVAHSPTDLHAVGSIMPGTVTCVRTSPRVRAWGFHPPGEPWVDADTYLARGSLAKASL